MVSPFSCSGVIICVATVPSSYLARVFAFQEESSSRPFGRETSGDQASNNYNRSEATISSTHPSSISYE